VVIRHPLVSKSPGPERRRSARSALDVLAIRRARRHFAGTCIDRNPNSQRRGHLNGALAAAITSRLFELGWIERGQRRRSVRVTPAGTEGMACIFGLDLA
jgi:hypothetical protein